MEFLGHMRRARVDTMTRATPRKSSVSTPSNTLGLLDEWIANRDVEAEGKP